MTPPTSDAQTIPLRIQRGLRTFAPRASKIFIHDDGRFGVQLSESSFQWIRADATYGWIDAGVTHHTGDAIAVPFTADI